MSASIPAQDLTPALTVADHDEVLVLRPRSTWRAADLRELWRHRDLMRFLALRDVQVRYKQTALGVSWAVLQPLLTMVVLAAVFGRFLGLSATAGQTPYAVFLYAGLLPWTLFASIVTASSNSLVSQAQLVGKVYFPRLVLPLAAAGAPLVDWGIASLVLLGLMGWHGVTPSWQVVFVPALLATLLAAALGVGILLSALTVTYRDFRYVVPFMLQVGFFLTPVLLPASALPAQLGWVLWLNPAAGTISAFRAAVLGLPLDYAGWAASAATSLACLLAGLVYFGRTERRFADVV